jgi:putative ABC transport system substrate-binding protein
VREIEERMRTSRPKGTSFATVALAAALAGALPRAAAAGSVVVLRGAEVAQYRAIEQSFMAALGQPARSVQIAGGDRAQARAAGSGADAVFAIGPEAAAAASELKAGVVYALVSTPERLGLDPRNAVPSFVPAQRQIRYLRAALPTARKVGLVYDPALSRGLAAEYEEAAREHGFGVVREEVGSRREVAAVVRSLVERVDVLWLIPDSTVVSPETFRFMMQISLETRVPVVGFSEGMTRGGALISVEGGFDDMGRRAAYAVRRVLAGRPAAPEPPEGTLSVNARSAELLGVSLPPALRAQAAKVFD